MSAKGGENMELNLSNNIYAFLEKNCIDKLTKFTVDKFENNFAICENRDNGKILDIPMNFISKDVKEGNIIKLENDLYVIDNETYKSELEEVKKLAHSVFKRKNKGE
jgi:hypothetical protein